MVFTIINFFVILLLSKWRDFQEKQKNMEKNSATWWSIGSLLQHGKSSTAQIWKDKEKKLYENDVNQLNI